MYLHIVHLTSFDPSLENYYHIVLKVASDLSILKYSQLCVIEQSYKESLKIKVTNVTATLLDEVIESLDFDFRLTN